MCKRSCWLATYPLVEVNSRVTNKCSWGIIHSIQSYFILVEITHRHQCLIHVARCYSPSDCHHPLSATPRKNRVFWNVIFPMRIVQRHEFFTLYGIKCTFNFELYDLSHSMLRSQLLATWTHILSLSSICMRHARLLISKKMGSLQR